MNHAVLTAGGVVQTVVPVPVIVAVVAAYKLYIFPAPHLRLGSPAHGIVQALGPTMLVGSGFGATDPA